jgi:hypothetical protein
LYGADRTCEVMDWRPKPLKPLRRQAYAAVSLDSNWNASGHSWIVSWTPGAFKLAFQLVGQVPAQHGYRSIGGLLLAARLRKLSTHSVVLYVPTFGDRMHFGATSATWHGRKSKCAHSLSRLPKTTPARDDVV